MSRPATQAFVLRLQVGRVLHGPLLLLAVLLRHVPALLLGGGGEGGSVAPAWVVVGDKQSGRTRWRVNAGRDYGSGEHLLGVMQNELSQLTEAEFEQRWRK